MLRVNMQGKDILDPYHIYAHKSNTFYARVFDQEYGFDLYTRQSILI